MRYEKTMKLFALLLLATTINGCAKNEVDQNLVDKRGLMQADLPSYQPGEFFIFDSGLSMIATGGNQDLVAWQYGNGATSNGYNNFIIPQLSWNNNSNQEESTTNVSSDILWPLRIGNSGSFSITQRITDTERNTTKEVKRNWKCRVEGAETVTVPAGNFDTYVVSCDRYSATSNEWRGRLRYYYSPDIRHYVMVEKDYSSRSSMTKRLVKHGFNSNHLPPKDQDSLKGELQKTLDLAQEGIAGGWTGVSGQINAMLIPYEIYKGPKGAQCREYRSVYNVAGRVHQHARTTCQKSDGVWQRIN